MKESHITYLPDIHVLTGGRLDFSGAKPKIEYFTIAPRNKERNPCFEQMKALKKFIKPLHK